jgi:hypothetical protein
MSNLMDKIVITTSNIGQALNNGYEDSSIDQLLELVFVEMQKRKAETGQGLWHFKNNLDKTYYRLANGDDSINQGKWVNLLNNSILSVTDSQVTVYLFDSYICLVDKLVDTWNCESYYYIETPQKLFKLEDLKRIKTEYDHVIQSRVDEGVEYAINHLGEDYDTSDEYRELNTMSY